MLFGKTVARRIFEDGGGTGRGEERRKLGMESIL
jgi:hypothetical protein